MWFPFGAQVDENLGRSSETSVDAFSVSVEASAGRMDAGLPARPSDGADHSQAAFQVLELYFQGD
jgi:hypothetical protein